MSELLGARSKLTEDQQTTWKRTIQGWGLLYSRYGDQPSLSLAGVDPMVVARLGLKHAEYQERLRLSPEQAGSHRRLDNRTRTDLLGGLMAARMVQLEDVLLDTCAVALDESHPLRADTTLALQGHMDDIADRVIVHEATLSTRASYSIIHTYLIDPDGQRSGVSLPIPPRPA